MTLKNVYALNDYQRKKPVVLVSGGFFQSGITTTARFLSSYIQQSFNVLSFDNAGHGRERERQFTFEGQKELLAELLSKSSRGNTDLHLVLNSLPAAYSVQALKELLSQGSQYFKTPRSITLLSPVLTIRGALEGDRAGHSLLVNNPFSKLSTRYTRSRKYIATPLAHHLLKTNADISKLFTLDAEFDHHTRESIQTLARHLPTHLIYNTADKAVVGPSTAVGCQRISEGLGNCGIEITSINTERHAIHLQEPYDSSTLESIVSPSIEILGDLQANFLSLHHTLNQQEAIL